MTKKRACPIIRWDVQTNKVFTAEGLPYRSTEIFGYGPDDTRLVKGELTDDPLMTPGGTMMVAYSYTHKDYRRCGFGTKLYERMRQIACDRGKRLASDTTRTKFSEGFWRKQVSRGRAKCLFKPRRWQRGEIPEDSSCGQYALKRACPAAGKSSLAGRKRRG